MTHTYQIKGITCEVCVANVKSELLKLGDVENANIQLAAPQATITMQKHIPLQTLQQAVAKAGNYMIQLNGKHFDRIIETEDTKTPLQTYWPLLLIFAYITAIAILT